MLKVEHVSYRYPNGERDVLQDVCCTLEDGQLSAIVGPSGSGKTTLLSILAGLDSPAEGSVSIDGEDYKSLDLDRCRRERIAMIFQAFHLFPLLNVVENVCFAMELNGVAKSKAVGPAKELLEMVGIGEEKHKRYPAHLSGGEQQRVAIARALASGARVILADEPTGNLDTANGDRVMEILQRLAHEEGYCVVVVTHDMSIAEAADQVLRMKDGLTQATPENWKNRRDRLWNLLGLVVPIKMRRGASEPAIGVRELIGLGVGFSVGVYGDAADFLLRQGPVVSIGLPGGNLIHHIHAICDLAKGGILAVQVLGVSVHDEKLAAGGVGGLGPSHGQYAPLVLHGIVYAVEQKLAFDAIARPAHAGAVGAATLDHEARNDPVKNQTVVKALLNQGDEIRNGLRGLLGIELSGDDAAALHFYGDNWVHRISTSLSWRDPSAAWRL